MLKDRQNCFLIPRLNHHMKLSLQIGINVMEIKMESFEGREEGNGKEIIILKI